MLGIAALSELPISTLPTAEAAGSPFGQNNWPNSPQRKQDGFAYVVSNLLLTTLAVVAVSLLPQGAGHSASLQTQSKWGLFPNADTSHGTPKTLQAELRDPFHVLQENQPRLAQHRDFERINANTSLGTAKTLRDDQIPPRFVAPHFAPNATWLKSWLPADATKGTPKTLITELVQPAGTVAPFIVPIATRIAGWLPADTSQGVAKTLRPELVKPFFVAPQFAPSAKPIAGWLPADTSQGQNPDLRVPPVVTSPPFLTPTLSPQLRWWQPADSSESVPKTLLSEVTLPFSVLNQSLVDNPFRSIEDTSQGLQNVLRTIPLPPGSAIWVSSPSYWYKPLDSSIGTPELLRPELVLPFAAQQQQRIDLVRSVTDTSIGSSVTLQVVLPPPPFVITPHFAPLRYWWQPEDTSAGIAKVLYSDSTFAIVNLSYPVPDRFRPVSDTSQGTAQYVFVIPPPPPAPVLQFLATYGVSKELFTLTPEPDGHYSVTITPAVGS